MIGIGINKDVVLQKATIDDRGYLNLSFIETTR